MALNAIGIDNFLAWVCQLAGLWGRGDKQRRGAVCLCLCMCKGDWTPEHCDGPSTQSNSGRSRTRLPRVPGWERQCRIIAQYKEKRKQLPLLFCWWSWPFPFFPLNPWFNLFTHVASLKFRISTPTQMGNYCFLGDGTQHPLTLEFYLTNFSSYQAEGAEGISLHFTYWGNWGMRRFNGFFSPALYKKES